ncbi:pentapeptide repeat-containing protein [Microbacterium sp. UCD-TDU]|uniref:pentapeptide repeat-containing protein n=1 Tax=Microbacterium sp. UCD-TDU TaxID=1247714 RepID=UPI0034D01018
MLHGSGNHRRDLDGCDLCGCDLCGCDLDGGDIDGGDLRRSFVDRSDLCGSIGRDDDIVDRSGADRVLFDGSLVGLRRVFLDRSLFDRDLDAGAVGLQREESRFSEGRIARVEDVPEGDLRRSGEVVLEQAGAEVDLTRSGIVEHDRVATAVAAVQKRFDRRSRCAGDRHAVVHGQLVEDDRRGRPCRCFRGNTGLDGVDGLLGLDRLRRFDGSRGRRRDGWRRDGRCG